MITLRPHVFSCLATAGRFIMLNPQTDDMDMMKFSILLAMSVLSTAAAASAAPLCYEDRIVPAQMTCSDNDSRSADFGSACKYVGETVQQVPVECPGRWVGVKQESITHAQACSNAGLKPTSIEGEMCASGERRPTAGEGAAGISYAYGKTGSSTSGGTAVVNNSFWENSGGCSPNSSGTCIDRQVTYTYCYGSGQKRDWDATDRVVAFACE